MNLNHDEGECEAGNIHLQLADELNDHKLKTWKKKVRNVYASTETEGNNYMNMNILW